MVIKEHQQKIFRFLLAFSLEKGKGGKNLANEIWITFNEGLFSVKHIPREFELATREFKSLSCKVDLVTRELELATREFESVDWTGNLWIWTRTFEFWSFKRVFKFSTRNT